MVFEWEMSEQVNNMKKRFNHDCHCNVCCIDCKLRVEIDRLTSLPEISKEETEKVWDLILESSGGPWAATQLAGFGAKRFIISLDAKEKWYNIVASLENSGSFKADDFIAWCRDGVPRLLNKIEKLENRIKELESVVLIEEK